MTWFAALDDEWRGAKRIAVDIRKLIDNGVLADQHAVLGRVKTLLGPVEHELLAVGIVSKLPLNAQGSRGFVSICARSHCSQGRTSGSGAMLLWTSPLKQE